MKKMAKDSDPEKSGAANTITTMDEKAPSTVDPNLVRNLIPFTIPKVKYDA